MRRFKSARHAQRFVEVHGSSLRISALDVTCFPRLIIADSETNDFESGTRSPAPLPSLRNQWSCAHNSSNSPDGAPRLGYPANVTMPAESIRPPQYGCDNATREHHPAPLVLWGAFAVTTTTKPLRTSREQLA
jgi:hypothetical protein